ncbi:uncharacterized protein [Parasteatoda tepidariorum]|nr:uncharacterized protein LOC107443034 [Parasteatoda tepidariorum]XP_015912263.1 uncharacterized protein LOC107443034 [Parasteatoda tepidariorum]XP_042899737.1 uncharacterized protein LOC107443034 [Parasteatoda tepidariorum]
MWSNVQLTNGCPAPTSRSKHAMCVSQEGFIYLLGGRSANLPLKDLWKFDPVKSVWEELKCRGNRPPCLQEHTMVCWKNNIYVFGGEIGFASTGETPLWILDLNAQTWRKHHVRGSSVHQPSGRRGHSAIMFDGFMHVFGGYQDLRGSSSELWIFDLATERWSLLMTPSYFEQPPPRHNHSCIVHDEAMWIYGGLTDLQPRNDFWKWDFGAHRWSRIKTQRGPGELHSHAAVKALGFMYVFGGERSGVALNELWRFHFITETWERINADGVIPPPRIRHVAVPNPAFYDSDAKMHAWDDPVISEEKVPNRANNPPKSISMCFGQTAAESENKKHFKFKVHPVSRFCSKNTGSDEDDDEEYTVSYNPSSAQVNLKTLRDKFHSSRLVRSISSGSYSILHNNVITEARRDELERLVEESTPHHRPRLKIQKSQSSDAVLESDSENATPQHQGKSNQAGNITDSPPLWVENPNTLLRSSWSESTFQHNRYTPPVNSNKTNGTEHNSCTTPTARLSRLSYDFSTVRDIIEENSENADEPNMVESSMNNENKNPNCNDVKGTELLIDLGDNSSNSSSNFKSSHTISDFVSQTFTPSIESRGLPHSVSHSSGYYSFNEEDNGSDCHREFAGCLNSSSTRKRLLKGRDLELKTFSPNDPQNHVNGSNEIILPPPPSKERARSLDRTSQRKLIRSYPSGGSITPTILMSTSIVEDSFVSRIERVPKSESYCVPTKKPEIESPNAHWSLSPRKTRPEQHQWQLCLYMFGGREQTAPGVYRQPISIWKFYV